MGKKSPNPIDKHVGARVRMRRMMISMSQEKLGGKLGITFQQIQKYEKGTNRIGASRVQQITDILGAPVAFFFEGAPSRDLSGEYVQTTPAFIAEVLATADGLALVRAFSSIEDSDARAAIVRITQAVSRLGEGKLSEGPSKLKRHVAAELRRQAALPLANSGH